MALTFLAKHDINKCMNITPLFAIALLLPSLTKNHNIQYSVPLSLMLVKDVFLGFHGLMIPVYSCLLIFVLLGRYISNTILATFLGVIIWHIVVNFAVWLSYGGNLLQIYIQAIPFDLNLLVSTLICVMIGKLCIKYYYHYLYY